MTHSRMDRPGGRAGRRALARLFCTAFCFLAVDLAHAQPDSVTLAAGPRYEAGAFRRALLGTHYRDLWTTPIRVEVLSLRTFAGGLTPVEEGGFKQTVALRLKGADGREYNFRSVDKDVSAGLPPYARGTLAERLWQDQVRAQHPVAPVVATALLDAVGVLNPGPRLVAMPDDPRLGEFRARFAGMLGTIEVHPEEGENGAPSFANAERVSGSDRLLEHLEEDADHRAHSREFLKARLMDVFLGDWDRHEGQWRWARFDSAGLKVWRPVPEDRDFAFVDYDGALPSLARATVARRLVRFQADYPPMTAMLANSSDFTRRLLADLPRPVWDSTAAWLKVWLTDDVIDRAVARMPAPYVAQNGPRLAAILRARRDLLPEAAADLYDLVAVAVEPRGTDGRDVLEVERFADGRVRVRITAEGAPAGIVHFDRTFLPDETEEVRVFLHGGDDVARVSGAGGSITVRVIGGGGDDVLEDRSRGPTAFYDDRGENRFVRGRNTTVSTRPYESPEEAEERREAAAAEATGEEVDEDVLPSSSRDWGSSGSLFTPWANTWPHVDVVVGGGPVWTRYGFRRDPFQGRVAIRGLWAPTENRFGVEVEGDFHAEASRRRVEALARASNLEGTRFNGFGNDSPDLDDDLSLVWQRRVEADLRWVFPLGGESSWLSVGPSAAYVDYDVPAGGPAAALASGFTDAAGQFGAAVEVEVDGRDDRIFPRRGFRLDAGTAAYGQSGGRGGAFGRVDGRASAYLSLGRGPVLALRAGAEHALGDYPLHEAAFLGGSREVRGLPHQRYAGDAAAYGGAELRLPLFPAELFIRGTLGVSAFADAGRVWEGGDSDGGWHDSQGAGVWFATPLAAVGAYYAFTDEGNRLQLRLGMPF